MTAPAGSTETTPTAPPAPAPVVTPPVDTYTAPESQADLDRIVEQRLSRERAKYGMTPEEAKQAKQRADELDAQNATEIEKREKAAREAADTDADAKYRPMLAETAFRVAIGERAKPNEVDDFIADLNLSRFLTDDGKVDTAKVLARVEQFVPSGRSQTTPTPRGPVVPGHNPAGAPPAKPGDPARSWLAKQGIKVD